MAKTLIKLENDNVYFYIRDDDYPEIVAAYAYTKVVIVSLIYNKNIEIKVVWKV